MTTLFGNQLNYPILSFPDRIIEKQEQMNEFFVKLIDLNFSFNYELKGQVERESLTRQLELSLNQLHESEEKRLFIDDVLLLSDRFLQSTKSKVAKVKIEVIKSDMCRLFHVDHIRQRLLCTYCGPGTEWLSEANVNYEGIGKGCNQNIVLDFTQVNTSNPLEVLLLKGTKYSTYEKGCVHHSPPIEKNQHYRLLLKIDEC